MRYLITAFLLNVMIFAVQPFASAALDGDGDSYTTELHDCDDTDPTIHPTAIEICRDGIDQNCDGVDLTICLKDTLLPGMVMTNMEPEIQDGVFLLLETNGDNKIGLEEGINALQKVRGLGGGRNKDYDNDRYTALMGDCNDTDPNIYPGATEICGDQNDQDCDGEDLLCAEDLDGDNDGYTPNDGDCDDTNRYIYPGQTETFLNPYDQNCDGCDSPQPENQTFVSEYFRYDLGGFDQASYYSVSNGRLNFNAATSGYIYRINWSGGSNPSHNFYPSPLNSNYFSDYYISVNTYWLDGNDTGVYGIFFDSHVSSSTGYGNYLMFLIEKSGNFSVYEYTDSSNSFNYLGGGYSFLLTRSTTLNTISIDKIGNNYRFIINDTEVLRLNIDNYPGGSLGLITSDSVKVSYDNFRVTTPAEPACSPEEFPLYSVADQNDFINQLMKSIYLWYDQVPNLQIDNYTVPEFLFEDLLYTTRDKWSYITSKEAYESHYEDGQYVGFGFSTRYDDDNFLRIAFVYPDSPADQAGMARGDQIIEINGKAISIIDRYDLWNSIYGERQIGVQGRILLKSPDGTIKLIDMEKAVVTQKTVLHSKIITSGNKKIGYLAFKSFINPSRDELNTVFTTFKNNGVNELIVDLRYNGGGRLAIANYLASLIGGGSVSGKTFDRLVHNINNQHRNYTYTFSSESNALSLNRVLFIVSDDTASASEAVISGLEPHMQVVLIGDTTAGKPVGSKAIAMGDIYVNAIQFKGLNSNNEGEFYDGINPDCYADDDLTLALGNNQESMLKTSLDYIIYGSCPAQTVFKAKLPVPRKKIDFTGFEAEIGAY